ncbi:MAG: hypothetical protein ACREEM_18555, partial [Blastocatellia bacterium]
MEMIHPEFKELQRDHQDLRKEVAQMRGELDEVKRTSNSTARQTIWQFVIFTMTMGALMLGAIRYQSDTLRKEMDLRFEAQRLEMNARFEAMEKRFNQSEQNIVARFEDLKQEVRAARK